MKTIIGMINTFIYGDNNMDTLWMVACLKKNHDVTIDGRRNNIPIKLSWADGMVGVIPVFDSHEAAYEYYGGNGNIYELEIKDK